MHGPFRRSFSRISVLILGFLLLACSGQSEDCQPDFFASGLPNPDAQAQTNDDIEVWGLFYPADARDIGGKPIVIDAYLQTTDGPKLEAKIVWRATGDGDLNVRGFSPDGAITEPIWKERHSGSGWDRPGDEWGTGWELDEPGCWIFQVERGGATAEISIEVRTA
jgi:hypothetical protein